MKQPLHNQETIHVIPRKQARNALLIVGVVFLLFIAASLMTQYNPAEFLLNMENFWAFIFEDLLPPKIANWNLAINGLMQTFAMATSATLISAVLSLVLAFMGSNTTAPWAPLQKVIRLLASFARNIPNLIWIFILIMSFGIGSLVGLLALIISSCGFLTRSFMEVIDEIGAESLESMRAVGAGRLATIAQVILPASLPGIVSWLMYAFETNIRSSTLVGAVGGGGIGLLMMGYIKQFRYKSAMGIILLVAATVILVDLITNFIRRRILS